MVVLQHGVVIQAHPLSLWWAINNLIDNALKYGCVANMSVQADRMNARIKVDDYNHGGGLEDLYELTTAFSQGHNASNVLQVMQPPQPMPSSMMAASPSRIGIR